MKQKALWVPMTACFVVLLIAVQQMWLPEHHSIQGTTTPAVSSELTDRPSLGLLSNRDKPTDAVYLNHDDKMYNTSADVVSIQRGKKQSHRHETGGVMSVRLRNRQSNEHSNSDGSVQENGSRSANSRPTEVHHIGFLKVHKAGSTTVQNLLFRFALSRNLTAVVPRNGHYFSHSSLKHHPVEPLPNGTHYDILACHSVFSADIYWQVLPRDSKFIAIVREPLELMVSAAFFYRKLGLQQYLQRVPENAFIINLIREPERYDNESFSRTKNPMARDFGFKAETRGHKEIDKYLKYLNGSFALVLVLDRFEESLVLMKRLFHWKLSDIIYLVSNSYQHQSEALDEADVRLFRKRNFLDVAIYEFFRNELHRKISLEGVDFREEVAYVKSVIRAVTDFCLNQTRPYIDIQATPWNAPFSVADTQCKLMQTPELRFLDSMRIKLKTLFNSEH